jgi:SAM-dependent methyltransferase
MGLDGNDDWSPIAAEWAARWGAFADPARVAILEAAGAGAGVRLLDAGCGSGELLHRATALGAIAAGCDPSPAMLALAGDAAPAADLRVAGLEALPWPDGAFDVVTAVNALQFAEAPRAALAEVRRVLAPGGRFAVANWAERAANDVDALERAVAEEDGEPPSDDPPERLPGGLEALLADAGFAVVASGVAETPWAVPDDASLVAGVLLGDDASVLRDLGPVVVAAAAPFRTPAGGYLLHNRLRWAVGRA